MVLQKEHWCLVLSNLTVYSENFPGKIECIVVLKELIDLQEKHLLSYKLRLSPLVLRETLEQVEHKYGQRWQVF